VPFVSVVDAAVPPPSVLVDGDVAVALPLPLPLVDPELEPEFVLGLDARESVR
jgi:hypothetical protein